MNLDGFSVGFSDDGARTFTKLMKFTELEGPLACSEVQTACAAHWARIQVVLGIADAGVPDAGTTPPAKPGGGSSGCSSAGGGTVSLLGLFALFLLFRRGPRCSL